MHHPTYWHNLENSDDIVFVFWCNFLTVSDVVAAILVTCLVRSVASDLLWSVVIISASYDVPRSDNHCLTEDSVFNETLLDFLLPRKLHLQNRKEKMICIYSLYMRYICIIDLCLFLRGFSIQFTYVFTLKGINNTSLKSSFSQPRETCPMEECFFKEQNNGALPRMEWNEIQRYWNIVHTLLQFY